MNGKNLIRRIGGFVLAALLLVSVGMMSSSAVEARGRGGFHGGGFHGGGFHHGPRFGFGVGYPYGYPAYPYPYGYYGHPYVHFGFHR